MPRIFSDHVASLAKSLEERANQRPNLERPPFAVASLSNEEAFEAEEL